MKYKKKEEIHSQEKISFRNQKKVSSDIKEEEITENIENENKENNIEENKNEKEK